MFLPKQQTNQCALYNLFYSFSLPWMTILHLQGFIHKWTLATIELHGLPPWVTPSTPHHPHTLPGTHHSLQDSPLMLHHPHIHLHQGTPSTPHHPHTLPILTPPLHAIAANLPQEDYTTLLQTGLASIAINHIPLKHILPPQLTHQHAMCLLPLQLLCYTLTQVLKLRLILH